MRARSIGFKTFVFIAIGVAMLGLAGCDPQSGPFAPEGGDSNPACSENSVERPDNEQWYDLYKYEGNPLAGMSTGATRVLNSSNPRITITKRGTDKFDWTSSKPVVAVVIKASTTASIWYYTPPATSGTGIYNATGYGTSHVSWCGDATTPPTTAAPSTTAAPVTTTPPTTIAPTTTSTPVTAPPE